MFRGIFFCCTEVNILKNQRKFLIFDTFMAMKEKQPFCGLIGGFGDLRMEMLFRISFSYFLLKYSTYFLSISTNHNLISNKFVIFQGSLPLTVTVLPR